MKLGWFDKLGIYYIGGIMFAYLETYAHIYASVTTSQGIRVTLFENNNICII